MKRRERPGAARRPPVRTTGRYWLAPAVKGLPRLALFIAAGLVAAALSLALTASTALRRSNPEMAVRLMPIDGLAVSYRAEQTLVTDLSKGPAQAAELARSALRLQPINPTALQILGIATTARGDPASGRALIAEAQQQSRRKGAVQLLLIEDAVRRGDVREALRQYDIVLRTKRNSRDTLFPVLLAALKEPAIRAELSRYYGADTVWVPQFASYALANSKDLGSLVALELESGGLKNRQLAHEQSIGLVERLVADNRFPEARRVYLAINGAAQRRLVDAGFDKSDIVGRDGAVGWQTRTQADASASFTESSSGDPELGLSANALTSERIATKLLYLPSGRYRVDVQLSAFDGGDGAAVGIQLRCPAASGDQPVWSQRGRSQMISGMFLLPAGCNAQMLDLVAVGGGTGSTLAATVRSVSVRPL